MPDRGDSDPQPAVVKAPEWLTSDKEYGRIVSEFVEALPSRVIAMRQALAENNLDALCRELHNLASASLFGYPDITAIVKQTSPLARAGQVDEVQQLVSTLDTLVQDIFADRSKEHANP